MQVTTTNVTSGYNLSKINNNFSLLTSWVNDNSLASVGGNNVLNQALDLNGNPLLNVAQLNVDGLTIAGQPVSISNLGALGPNSVGTAQIVPGAVVDASVTSITAPKIKFLAAGVSAGLRDTQSKLRDTVSVKDFMCSDGQLVQGDGVHDDTSGMQAAHNTGKRIYYPFGTYKFSTITMVSGGIVGDGTGSTLLLSTDTTSADLVTYTGTGGSTQIPLFRDFLIQGVNGKASGAGINFKPGTGELNYINIDNIITFNIPVGVHFTAASNYSVSNSKFINYTSAGLYIENLNHVDSGDSAVTNCLFNTGQPSGQRFGIWYRSSGGLKVTNSKFNGGGSGFVLGFVSTTFSTGDLAISNCSIENMTDYAIYLGRDAGTFQFGAITLANVQIAICGNGIVTDNSGAITQMSITGHNIALASGNGYCVQLNSVSNFVVGPGNLIGSGGNPNGINTNATCTNGKIMLQTCAAIPAANRVVNSSPSVLVETDRQVGVVASVTTSTAYGSLFTGTVPVTFPVGFSTVPTVICNASGAGGGISAFATNVTVNGFVMQVVGATSGGVVTNCPWSAQGTI